MYLVKGTPACLYKSRPFYVILRSPFFVGATREYAGIEILARIFQLGVKKCARYFIFCEPCSPLSCPENYVEMRILSKCETNLMERTN